MWSVKTALSLPQPEPLSSVFVIPGTSNNSQATCYHLVGNINRFIVDYLDSVRITPITVKNIVPVEVRTLMRNSRLYGT